MGPFSQFFCSFNANVLDAKSDRQNQPLTEDRDYQENREKCSMLIVQAVSVLFERVKELFSGHISLSNLNSFEHQKYFLEILAVVDEDSKCVPDIGQLYNKRIILEKVLEWRKIEEREYHELRVLWRNLLGMSYMCKTGIMRLLYSLVLSRIYFASNFSSNIFYILYSNWLNIKY